VSDIEQDMIKVRFDLSDVEGAPGGETMWATKTDYNHARLENIPFFAYGYAIRDIVKLRVDDPEDFPEVLSVETPSGEQTLRVLTDTTLDEEQTNEFIKKLADRLHEAGATIERGYSSLVAISALEGEAYDATVAILTELELEGQLQWEDGMSMLES